MKYIETDKFIDTSIALRTILPLKRETVTSLNVLILMMRGKSEELNTKQKFSMACNKAYGFRVIFGLVGFGQSVALDIRFQYIRQEYVDAKGYIDQILYIMKQVLEHPCLVEASFEEARYLLKERLQRQMDDPDSLALINALKILGPEETISIPVQGNLKDLEKCTFEDVLQVYQEFQKAPKTLSICGKVEDEILEYLCRFDTGKKPEGQRRCLPCLEYRQKEICKQIFQSSLVQIYATQTDMLDRLYYPLLVMNSILGQSPMSFLFEEIREKHSYCYSISSMLLRFDCALVITCGTSAQHLGSVKELIESQIKRLRDGDFDEQDIKIAKIDLIDMVTGQADRAFGMMEQAFLDQVLDRENETTQSRIASIQAVTKEEIMEAASRLVLVSSVSVVEENHEI